MELNELVQEVKSGLESFKADANKTIGEQKSALAELKEKLEQLGKLEGVAKAADVEQIRKDFDELAMKFNEAGSFGGNGKVVSFHDAFAKPSAKTTPSLYKNIARGRADQKTGRPGGSIELKDMDFGNFGTGAYEAITTETRPGVYQSPFNPVWLRNIVPNGSTTSEVIQYLRENGGSGAADVWDGRYAAGK